MADRRMLRCHRCRSMRLILREPHYEWAEYDGGLFIREDGQIAALGDGCFDAGDPERKLTEIECESCGHTWHPRRVFAGTDA
jgi:hypothetical protein